jgi:protein-S-isoprenylcysteine O-methyltransferase Ste14
LSSWLALLFVPVFVIYISRFQIQPEERAMLSLFGPDYSSYQAKVRRWL